MPRTKSKSHKSSSTKAVKITRLLQRNNGATIAELAKATGWQLHSVRGFLSGTLKKRRGLLIIQTLIDGIRHYSIEQPPSGR